MTEKEVRRKAPFKIANIGTAIEIYYTYPEMQNEQIRQLFGVNMCNETLAKYKRLIKARQRDLGVKTCLPYSVNTKTAFEVFGIDINDLEQRYNKLKKLGFAK